MKKVIIALFIITVLGGFCRFWRLSSHPVSLSMNEAAIAYNSYSILKTKRDEWGVFLPFSFRSVGDYKAPVLIYLMVPTLAVLGLNEFSVRFTIALFGVLTLPAVFFLIEKLSKNKKIALLTTFSLAISPWHIQFSRATFEAILALFFLLLGALLFLTALENKGKFLWLSIVSFVLSLYTYHAERVFTPIFVLGLFVIFHRQLLENKKAVLKSILLGIILMIPFIKIMLSPEGQVRAKMTFLANDAAVSFQLHQPDEKLSLKQKIFDNNAIILGNFWIKRYLNYFDPGFLFFKGSQFTLPNIADVGLMYSWELPLFFLGIWQIFIKRKIFDGKALFLVVFWFLLGPLVASFTNNEQHSLRSLVWIPIPQLIIGVGSFFIYKIITSFPLKKKLAAIAATGSLVIVSLIYFFDIYMVHFPAFFSECWDYGYKEAAQFVWEHQKEYKEIVIDPVFGTQGPYTFSVPYLQVLFYGQYPPELFQKDPARKRGADSVDFANFTFKQIYWPDDRAKENTLFIGSPWSLPLDDLKEANILKKIPFKNGAIGFLIVETK